MWIDFWFRFLTPSSRKIRGRSALGRRQPRVTPFLERLEDRTVPTPLIRTPTSAVALPYQSTVQGHLTATGSVTEISGGGLLNGGTGDYTENSFNANTGAFAGVLVVTTPDGSTLTSSVVGSKNLNTGATNETLTVTGGTGVFSGASGTSTAAGTVINGVIQFTDTGTIFILPTGFPFQSTVTGQRNETGSTFQITGDGPLNGASGVFTRANFDANTGDYSGTVVDTTPGGSTLDLNLTGNETQEGAVTESLTVTGGTGIFLGATGETTDNGTDMAGTLNLNSMGTLYLSAAAAPYQSTVTGQLTATGSVTHITGDGLLNGASGVFTESSFNPVTDTYSGTLVDTIPEGSTLTSHLVGQQNLSTGAVTETYDVIRGTGIFRGAHGSGTDQGTITNGNIQLTAMGTVYLADVDRLNATDWDGQISGSAPGALTAGIQGVSVSILDLTTGLYWDANSSAFDLSSENLLAATYTAATGSWTLPFSASAFTDGDSYAIHSVATDTSSDVQAIPGLATFVFDMTAPATPTLTVTDVQGVTSVNTPLFSGTAEAYSSVQVWNNTVFLGQTNADGTGNWSFQVGSAGSQVATLADGVYSITATATDAAGNVSAPTAPLALTVNTATPTIATDTPTFNWAQSPAAASYNIWITDNTTVQAPVEPVLNTTGTSLTLTNAQALTPGNNYTWYVGTVGAGGTSWGSGMTFTISRLAAPTANLPDTSQTTDEPTFSWTAAAGAGTNPASYELWIQDQQTTNITMIPDLPTIPTSYTLSTSQALTPGDSFVWYVGAVSTNGKAITWSNGVSFTIAALPAPTANTPSTALTTDQPAFSWTAALASGTAPATYELWILDQTAKTVMTVPNLPTSSTSYTLTANQALTPGDSFTWWVGAVSTNNKAVAWSNGVNFTIAAAAAPTANTPNTAVTTDEPTFAWTAAMAGGTAPATYELWILDQTTTTVMTIPNLPTSSTTYTLTANQALTPGDSFTWWVGAVSTNSKAVAWSNGVKFTIAALAAPTANTPSTALTTDEPAFSWTAATANGTAPATYELWILDQTTTKVMTIPNLPTSSTTYILTANQALTPGDSFTWWVGAVSTNNKAIAWSNAVNFSIAALGAPIAISPTSAVTGVISPASAVTADGTPAAITVEPTFMWSAADGGTPPATYELWIKDLTANTILTIPNLPASSTSYQLTDAQALTLDHFYTWWVGAVSTNTQVTVWSNGVNFQVT